MSTAPAPQPPRRNRKLLFKLLALVLGLVLAEVGFRGALAVAGRAHDGEAVREALLDMAASGKGGEEDEAEEGAPDGQQDGDPRREWKAPEYRIHPYLGYEPQWSTAQVRNNAAMLRQGRNPRTLFVCILGGSVAQAVSRLSYPAIVQRIREDERFRDVQVFVQHFARPAHKQPQQVNQLVYLMSCGVKPDVVINLDGFNEMAVAATNLNMGVHPAYPSFGQYAHLAVSSERNREALELSTKVRASQQELARKAERALRFGVHRSAIVSTFTMPSLGRLAGSVAEGFERYQDLLARPAAEAGGAGKLRGYADDKADIRGPIPEEGFDDPLGILVDIWEQGSISLKAICDAHDIHYVHCLQPTLHDPGSKPLTEEEIQAGSKATPVWVRAASEGFPRLRDRGKALQERGIHFVDTSYVFQDNTSTLYYDACHFVQEGCDITGVALAEAYLETWKGPAPR